MTGELMPGANLVALYHFNGDALDYSGNGNNLTLRASASVTSQDPRFGSDSIKLVAASSQYADTPHSASLNITGNLTVMAWIKPGATQSSLRDIATKWDNNGRSWFFYVGAGNTLHLIITANAALNGSDVSVSLTTVVGKWQHVAAVFDTSGNINFYNNGDLIGSGTSTDTSIASSATTNLAIGCDTPNSGATNFFDGSIDDVCVFSTNLSTKQIKDYYAWAKGLRSGVI